MLRKWGRLSLPIWSELRRKLTRSPSDLTCPHLCYPSLKLGNITCIASSRGNTFGTFRAAARRSINCFKKMIRSFKDNFKLEVYSDYCEDEVLKSNALLVSNGKRRPVLELFRGAEITLKFELRLLFQDSIRTVTNALGRLRCVFHSIINFRIPRDAVFVAERKLGIERSFGFDNAAGMPNRRKVLHKHTTHDPQPVRSRCSAMA